MCQRGQWHLQDPFSEQTALDSDLLLHQKNLPQGSFAFCDITLLGTPELARILRRLGYSFQAFITRYLN